MTSFPVKQIEPCNAILMAMKYLTKRVAQLGANKCAVAIDIDETILFNKKCNKIEINYIVRQLFGLCKNLGVSVYIITARPDNPDNRKFTVDDLTNCGYPPGSYEHLYMQPERLYNSRRNFSSFKATTREKIVRDTGKTLVLNVGDQWSDMMKLPPYVPNTKEIKWILDLPSKHHYIGKFPDVAEVGIKLPD